MWFCSLLACSECNCDWSLHNQNPRNFSGVHSFLSVTVKGFSLIRRLSKNINEKSRKKVKIIQNRRTSLFTDPLFSLSRSSSKRMKIKTAGDLLTTSARGWLSRARRFSIFEKKKLNNVCVQAIGRLAVYKVNYIDEKEEA